MNLKIGNISEENKSHVCSAQSDTVSSLQFDKRVKFRSYSSQFTLSDEILVGIDRREEMRPIENNLIVEVDLCTGIFNVIKSTIQSKYQSIIHLDEMANTNTWVRKMITYDVFVDKDVMQSIRDEAMEPNKLYLLKHKHKEQTTESLGNYMENQDFPKSRKLRTTAAQFNPNDHSNRLVVDRIVHSSNDNSRNVFFKSKNVLRNELIIRTGDFVNRPIDNDQEKYSSSLSVDLTTHKIPQIASIEDLTIYDDNLEIPKSKENTKNEVMVIEYNLVESQKKSIEVDDDIPFAEESETAEKETIDNKRNTLSKSLQYYLPVFDANDIVKKTDENDDSESNSNYSRSAVTTDENESMDHTDKPTLLDELDNESLNIEEFNESITENKKDSASNSNEMDNYSLSSERNSYIFDRSFDLDDVICQENLVIHINKGADDDFINFNEFSQFQRLVSETKSPISQFDIINLKRNGSLSPLFQHNNFHTSVSFPKDFIEQRKEVEEQSDIPINEIYVFNENEIESNIYNSGTNLEDLNFINEDAQIFTKTKSFNLKRKSEYPEGLDDQGLIIYSTKDDKKSLKNLYSDRKEKFFNSDLNSSIQFFKPVSDDNKISIDTRSSTPSSETETESVKKIELSICSSDDSMIIKDVSSDGAYEFRGQPRKIKNKISEEDEDELENDDSKKDMSIITDLTEEIPNDDRSFSISENLSVYSSSSTLTGSEIILRDLSATPIDSTPGQFEKFLKEREDRILKEKNSTDETSSYSEEKLEHATLIKNENLIKSEETENTNESTCTEDTSSSSSDYPQIKKAVLRQGESIEDIAKYLTYPCKKNKSLRRTSGFDSQLDTIYNQEDKNINLLQNDNINKREFSTSSDDNMSLKVSNPQNKFIERTEKLTVKNIPDKKSFPKNDESSSETENSDSKSNSKELPKIINAVAQEQNIKISDKVFVITKFNKQHSLPTLETGEISSSSDSENTNSISTSTEETHENYKDEKKKTPKYVEREEKFSKNPSVKKQMSLPMKKNKGSSSSSENESSSRSISTSEDEINPVNLKYTDRRESQLNVNPIKNQRSITVSKKILSNLSKSSESSKSFSTSEEDIPPPKNLVIIKSTSIDKINMVSSQSLNKKLPVILPRRKSSSSLLSDKNGSSRSTSTSSNESRHSYINLTQAKFIDKNKCDSSQSIDKKIISSNSKKEELHSPINSSSESVSTSSDEDYSKAESKSFIKKNEDNFTPEIITNESTLAQEDDNSYISDTSSTDEFIPLTIKKESSVTENKTPLNLSIDRREKFTNLDHSHVTSGFTRSASVPNYLLDSSNLSVASSINENSLQKQENLSQSLKAISNDSNKNNLTNNGKIHSYELLSVQIKDNVITRFIESRRKYTDNLIYADTINLSQSNIEYISKKNSSLSIDRREKFCSTEELDRITPCDNFKDEAELKNCKNSISSLSTSSESISLSSQISENEIFEKSKKLSKENHKMEEIYIDVDHDIHENKYEDEFLNKSKGSQNEDDSYSISTSDSSYELSEEKKNDRDLTSTENKMNKLHSIDRLEKFTGKSNVYHQLNKSKQNESISEDSSSSESLENDNLDIRNNLKIDHDEKFDNFMKNKNQISRPKSIELLSNYSNSSSEKFKSISNHDNLTYPNKSTERREKFSDNYPNSNIRKKRSEKPTSLSDQSDSSYNESSSNKSSENSGSSSKSGKISTGEGKSFEIERRENQHAKHLQYEQSKMRSDSTDEDISLSLTSFPKENQDYNLQIEDSFHSNIKDIEIIVVDKVNQESKINDADQSISISTTISISKDKMNHKYDKNDKYVSRSCQTLPYNKIQMIPVKQKSKSLDKSIDHSSLPNLTHGISGSFGSIVERRYHEFTENWSRQSPIGSINSKENRKKPVIDHDHISAVKNTDLFIKKKYTEPLTTRPRPVPSYLSPVNAFPYVPTDPEFSSADSLINDYSSDYHANEIIPRFKSLPDFVKSLSTTSLPKQPVISKTERKTAPVKKKSPPQTINLNYGAIENKSVPRSKFKKKTSVTSVTTDSSYLEKPILKEKETFNNYASSDSLSSLTNNTMTQQPKTNPTTQTLNNKANLENVSSTDSSSDSDTQIESQTQSLNIKNKSQQPGPRIINGKQAYIRKANSLPQKRIPSSSESSEFSSTSDDDSAEIHHF